MNNIQWEGHVATAGTRRQGGTASIVGIRDAIGISQERHVPQPAHDGDVGQPATTASAMQVASSGEGMSPQPAHDSEVGQPAALATAMQIGIQRADHDTTAGTRQQGRTASSDSMAQVVAVAGYGEDSEGKDHGKEGGKRSGG